MNVVLEGVVKRYGEVVAVRGVSLRIESGEFVTLLGPSGCGKTTTLRMIAGLERPDAGIIRIGDHPVVGPSVFVPPEKRDIGMIFQSYAIWPHMTVFDNVAYGLRVKGVKGDELRRRVLAGLDLVGLATYADRLATDLSGGQQQRVAVARSVVIEPRVLLFDEPLSNLDAKLRERMRFELRALQRKLGVTSIYVTHDQAEAMAMSDRIVVMNEGRVQQVGTPRDIYERPVNMFVADFIGLINLVPARLVEVRSDGTGVARTKHDQLVEVPAKGLRPGIDVNVGFRPENVKLLTQDEAMRAGANVWPVVVSGAAFLGNIMDLLLDWRGRPVRAQLPPGDYAQVAAAGSPCFAHVPTSRWVTIPEGTGG